MTHRSIAWVAAIVAAVATFAFVQYVGGDRVFSADVNITGGIFAGLVGILAFRLASHRQNGTDNR